MVDFYRSLVESITNTSNRITDGMVVEAPENIAVEVVQDTVPSKGSGKRRRPPVTVVANVGEVPGAVPKAARPCRETRRVGRSRVGTKPPPGCRLCNRALQSTSCDARTTQKGL